MESGPHVSYPNQTADKPLLGPSNDTIGFLTRRLCDLRVQKPAAKLLSEPLRCVATPQRLIETPLVPQPNCQRTFKGKPPLRGACPCLSDRQGATSGRTGRRPLSIYASASPKDRLHDRKIEYSGRRTECQRGKPFSFAIFPKSLFASAATAIQRTAALYRHLRRLQPTQDQEFLSPPILPALPPRSFPNPRSINDIRRCRCPPPF